MRRKDRELCKPQDITAILDKCKVFRLSMAADNTPYVVPLNFGYTWADHRLVLYFHCAGSGKKLDIIRQNSLVCFEMDCDHALTAADIPCAYGYNYSSVIGTGHVQILTDLTEKKRGLQILMRHQTGQDFTFWDEQASHVTVCKIEVSELSAKQRAL